MSKKVGLPAGSFVDTLRTECVEPIGELTVGGGSANTQFLITALCILNHPDVNNFFLKNKLKFKDRLTGTQVFPREGMLLPNGEVYKSPEPTSEEQNNAS
jgi:hypothetical protein